MFVQPIIKRWFYFFVLRGRLLESGCLFKNFFQQAESIGLVDTGSLDNLFTCFLFLEGAFTARESARAFTNFLRHHDPPMTLQVFGPHGKSLSF